MTRAEEMEKAKAFKRLRPRYFILVAVIVCAVLLPGNDVILAIEDDQSMLPESAEQQSAGQDEQEAIKGYPVRKRRIGGPTDVEWDLDNSFPKRGSVLELFLQCDESQQQ
jgi:hypothetical protein